MADTTWHGSSDAIDVQLEAAQGRVDELREDVREKGRPSSHYVGAFPAD